MSKNSLRRILLILLVCMMVALPVSGANLSENELSARSAVLMEASTGQILWAKDPDTELPPASVTKIMTLLLAMEAMEKGQIGLEDQVRVSAYAASMGGSQVYMAEGELFTLREVLKCIAISSANDASVALAERLCGTVGTFVEKMNDRARELGCRHTCFVNCNGLPAPGHYMSAGDIARISRELISHKEIFDYTTIRSDSIRNGSFTLTNTNKLLQSFPGINGLKTGSTSEAGYCMSATAEREGMTLIAVVLNAKTGQERFLDAEKLLEYGFANYTLAKKENIPAEMKVTMGDTGRVPLGVEDGPLPVLPKDKTGEITVTLDMADAVAAPVRRGQILGKLTWHDGEKILGQISVVAGREEKRMPFHRIFRNVMAKLFFIKEKMPGPSVS